MKVVAHSFKFQVPNGILSHEEGMQKNRSPWFGCIFCLNFNTCTIRLESLNLFLNRSGYELRKKLSAVLMITVILSLVLDFNNLSFAIDNEELSLQLPTKLINVPYINQDEIVYGCEAVSSTMLLQYYKYDISEKDFTDNYLIKRDWYEDIDGKVYGPDPAAAYPGSPYIEHGENCGYGSYAPSTAKSINKILDPIKHEAKVTTGMNLPDLVVNYIDKGIPVLIWATMDMKATQTGDSWIINYVDENSVYKLGDRFTWPAGEHCLVLVGYDDNSYYFNDPYKNHGLITYSKTLVNQRFNELGKQSVVILKK